LNTTAPKTQRILGIEFFDGTVDQAVETMCERGGLLVVPAAPALVNIQYDAAYREALVRADLAIADSGFMVLLWRLLKGKRVHRISGLVYLQRLLELPELHRDGAACLVLPNQSAREKAIESLCSRGCAIDQSDCYIAPQYDKREVDVTDSALVHLLSERKPQHVIIAIGGGTQEKLGLHLRDALEYGPAIHCIGAALGFLTGDQKPIPSWADQLYLGWLLRLARDPRRYMRRFWAAHELPRLIANCGSELPAIKRKN
jgi:UDP-N-acetyl-D-mannosaminuronic acid transferase (WecB/TagA/CpsF family)